MSKRSEWVQKIVPLREQGLTYREISEQIGLGESCVRSYLTDPDGEKERARGRKYRQHRKTHPPEPLVPVERFAPILRGWLDGRSKADVARECGLGARQIDAYLNGERQHVMLRVVENACARMGRPDIMHVELADIYEAL